MINIEEATEIEGRYRQLRKSDKLSLLVGIFFQSVVSAELSLEVLEIAVPNTAYIATGLTGLVSYLWYSGRRNFDLSYARATVVPNCGREDIYGAPTDDYVCPTAFINLAWKDDTRVIWPPLGTEQSSAREKALAEGIDFVLFKPYSGESEEN